MSYDIVEFDKLYVEDIKKIVSPDEAVRILNSGTYYSSLERFRLGAGRGRKVNADIIRQLEDGSLVMLEAFEAKYNGILGVGGQLRMGLPRSFERKISALYASGKKRRYVKANYAPFDPVTNQFDSVAESHTLKLQSDISSSQTGTSKKLAERPLPAYLTGNYPQSHAEPSYPAYRNTRTFPDESVRELLQDNNHDILLLTLPEAFAYLQSEGWKQTKQTWVETTHSTLGQVMINYGVNGKDVVTTSMIIARLGDLGIKATVEINHLGNEIIKFTGWPNVRQILNAPRFRLDNPKVVDVGIGKYGLKNSIVSGARLTFYVAAAYRTVDYILNDETTLATYIGSLATDVVKIGIASAVSWGAGATAAALTSFVAGPLVAVVIVGLFVTWRLAALDEKFGITDKVIEYIEHSQQEVIEKAREIEDGLWDIGVMMIDGMLETGKSVVESEIRAYLKNELGKLTPRYF